MTEQFPEKPQPQKKDIPTPSETEANETRVIQFYVDLQTKAYTLRLADKEREEIRMQLIDLTRMLDHLSLDADFRSDMRTQAGRLERDFITIGNIEKELRELRVCTARKILAPNNFERVMALCQEATDKGMQESVLMSFAKDVGAYIAMANAIQR